MRRFLMSSVALAAMSATAFAADLPARVAAPMPAPVYAAPIFTWTGFYVGLNAGATFNSDDRNSLRAFALPGANTAELDFVDDTNFALGDRRRDDDDAGFTGGAQIGYNWQFGSLVVGLEADINYRNRGGHGNYAVDIGLDREVVVSGDRGSNWFATIRPRLGFAMDRTLLYVTGGLAYAGGGSDRNDTVDLYSGGNLVATWDGGRRSGSDWGWTLGGGVEHAFSNNWTAKLEYLYVDLDRGHSGDLVTLNPRVDNVVFNGGRSDDNFHVVRVGLNYKFGGGASSAPVLARY